MNRNLIAQIDGTFYANLHYGLIREVKKRGVSANSEEAIADLLKEVELVYDFCFILRPVMRQIIGTTSPAFDFELMK